MERLIVRILGQRDVTISSTTLGLHFLDTFGILISLKERMLKENQNLSLKTVCGRGVTSGATLASPGRTLLDPCKTS